MPFTPKNNQIKMPFPAFCLILFNNIKDRETAIFHHYFAQFGEKRDNLSIF